MRFTCHSFLAIMMALICGAVAAQGQGNWPAGKRIRIIVPFPAGGQTDIAARVIGQAIGESLNTPVVVENRAGGHGFIGMSEAAKAPADGHTLVMASTGSIAINPMLHKNIPYDPNLDLMPVSLVMTVPIAIVVNPQMLPVKTIHEFLAYLNTHPGRVNFASAGNGGSSHLVAEYFKYRTGARMTHVPYKGEAPAIGDVVAGHVHLMFNTMTTSTPHLKTGVLRILAVTTRERLPEYPDVPTIAESLKMEDFEASSWAALYTPAGTPPVIVQRLSAEVDGVLKNPAVARRLSQLGAVPAGGTPAKLAAFQRSEQEKWSKVIQAGRIKAD